MSQDGENSNKHGTLCDVNQVENVVTTTDLKDLVCVLVDTISTDAGREVHAKLIATYKAFAKSTPVEGKLAESNRLEFYNKTRAAVHTVVFDLMEYLSFGTKEAKAVANLVAAGAASEKVGYMKSPAGVNMSQLLSKASLALSERTGPKMQAANTTKSRSSTEFWSADESRPKLVHRHRAVSDELSDSAFDEDVTAADPVAAVFQKEAKTLAPEVMFDDEDISHKERRKSLELISKFTVPGGPFMGTEDKRSVRRLLRWIKQEAEDKCLTPLETYFLIRVSFKDRLIRGLARAEMKNQEEVHEVVVENFAQLLAMFAPTLQQERNRLRRSQIQFRLKYGESIQEALVRYDELLDEMIDFDIPLTEMDKISVFMYALKDDDRVLAVTVLEHCKPVTFENFRRRMITHAQTKMQQQFVQRRPEYQGQQKDQPKPDGPKADQQKEGRPYKREEQNKKPQYHKFKKPESNHVDCSDADEADEESEYESQQSEEAELNIVDVGKSPDSRAIITIPKIHYSQQKGVADSTTAYEASLPNDGPGAALLDVDIVGRHLSVLVDSGATRSLLDTGFMSELTSGSPIESACYMQTAPVTVTYADGHTEKITLMVELPILVKTPGGARTFNVRFLLLPYLKRGIILGRDAMDIIGIRLVLGDVPSGKAEPPDDPDNEELECCMVAECAQERAVVDLEEAKMDNIETALIHNETSQHDDHPVIAQVHNICTDNSKHPKKHWKKVEDEDIRDCALELLTKIRDRGWLEMAEKYKIRIRKIGDDEDRDTEQQIFRFEVGWSLDAEKLVEAKKPWNSQGSIDRLSSEQLIEWKSQIEGYVQQKWWIADEANTHEIPGATVFPVLQCSEKTTTVRPCSDFRILNSISPRVSSIMPSVAQAVWRLRSRIKPGDEVHQLDLAKAFYRIATFVSRDGERLPLILKIGRNTYKSDRLVFGLACGPQGLICSQLIVEAIVKECAKALFTDECKPTAPIVVMDDFVFVGESETCKQTIRIYDVVWNMTGFECPVKKRAVWSDEHETRWLGQHYRWNPAKPVLSMSRSAIEFNPPKTWTKRQAFRAAGQFCCGRL